MQLSKTFAAVSLAGALVLGAACSDDDDDPTGPSMSQVAGSYQATTFTATAGSVTQNVLQAGGSLTMEFAASGALTGHIEIPTESVDEDFAGSWKIDDGEVEIEEIPGNDLLVENLKFTLVGNTLVADETFSNTRVQVVLTKR